MSTIHSGFMSAVRAPDGRPSRSNGIVGPDAASLGHSTPPPISSTITLAHEGEQ